MNAQVPSIIAALVFFARAASADAEVDRQTCEGSFESGQRLWHDHKLVEARASLVVCSHDPCDPVLQKPCQEWLADLETRVASIVVSIHDARGGDVTRGEVAIDGHATSLDGHAIELDPGEHRVHVVTDGNVLDQTILLTEGEKRRAVAFQLAAPPASALPVEVHERARSSAPWAAIGVSALAAVAGGLTIGFGLEGLSQRSSQCPSGMCPTASAHDSVEGWYIAADTALGVTVAAGVLAIVLFALHPHAKATTTTAFAF